MRLRIKGLKLLSIYAIIGTELNRTINRNLGEIQKMKMNEMQEEIYQNKLNKGFNVTDINEEFCLLYGEVAEAYDAWRKKKATIGEELADIAIYLMGLSEILDIDLESEIEKKVAINKDRVYKLVDGVLTKTTTSSDN